MTKNVHLFVSLLFTMLILVSSCTSHWRSKQRSARTSGHQIERKNSDLALDKHRKTVVSKARKLVGSKYKYGGKRPSEGFDCSGFTHYIISPYNQSVKGPSYAQARIGKSVRLDRAVPGDLVFFKERGKVNHVGIILENADGRLLVAHSTSSAGVKIDDVYRSKYWSDRLAFARRVLP